MGSTKAPSGVHQRPVEVQMYSSTDVWGVQENVAIEDGGSWLSVKKGPSSVQLRIVEKTVGQMWGGDMEESRSPKPPTLGEWFITKHGS